MNIGEVVEALKAGKRVARAGWNGKGMFLFLVKDGWRGKTDGAIIPNLPSLSFVAMRTADPSPYFIPWLCSQADLLSDDWTEVDIDGEPKETP